MDIETKIFLGILVLLIFSWLQLTISHKIYWRRMEKLTSLLRSKSCQAKDTKKVFIISSFLKTGISVCDTNYPFAFHILNYNNVYIPHLEVYAELKEILEKSFSKKLVASITSMDS